MPALTTPPTRAALVMDNDAQNLGNSPGDDGRGRLHTYVANKMSEPVPVTVVNPATNTTITTFGQISAVPAGVETQIVTYTVPGGDSFSLTYVHLSGDNGAVFNLYINGVIQDRCRTYWCNFTTFMDFGNGIPMNAGDIVSVKVIHYRPEVGDFASRIQGVLS